MFGGGVKAIVDHNVQIRLRQSRLERTVPVTHIINCMGSSFEPHAQPLMQALLQRKLVQIDALRLGICATNHAVKLPAGELSSTCYVLGPPMRGALWESIAVPEIRKQCKALAKKLLMEE